MVSIIVRTKDRAEMLKRTLQSIASQTYRPIEVVVVNDGGCNLNVQELEGILGNLCLHYILLKENTGRAHAGNVGIENAHGQYIGFLDDDDEFFPHHVQTLLSFLEHSDYNVAYTAAEMILNKFDAQKNCYVEVEKIRVFGKEFSYDDLLIENYIPLMTLLFKSEILKKVKFDTSFDLFEDWDMLLRAGKKNNFHFINEITARYHQWGGSQIALRSSEEDIKQITLRIYKRHFEQIPYIFILDAHREKAKCDIKIRELEEGVKERDTEINNLEEDARERDMEISNLESKIEEKEAYLQHIFSSHGWKMLTRYYRIRDTLIPIGTVRRKIAKLIFRLPGLITRENIRKIVSYLKMNGIRALIILVKHKLAAGMTVIEGGVEYENICHLWLDNNMPKQGELKKQGAVHFVYTPKISIIVPTFNTPKQFIVNTIKSVLHQTYMNWELCIADASGQESHVRDILKTYADGNKNIKVRFLSKNMGIAGNSNEALSLATGEFVGFLDHDDELTPDALYEVVKTINENPYVDFLYTDEIRMDSKGKILSLTFRPQFSEYYYMSHPYLVHFNVFRKSLIDSIRGFNSEDFQENVSHDVDFVLRIIASTEPERIIHIPKPLYKWRIFDTSAGHVNKEKVNVYTKKALQRFLDTKGLNGYVEDGMHFNTFHVRFRMREQKKVSIIILTKNNYAMLRKNLRSIDEKTDYDNYEVLIISNNTTDKEAIRFLESIRRGQKYRVIEYNRSFNFSALNNFGVEHTEGEFLLFLNDDIEVINREWLTSMVEIAQDQRVGIVGAKLLYPNNRIQHAGVVLGLMNRMGEHTHKFMNAFINKKKNIYEPGYEGSLVCIREYSAVTGACMLTKRTVFEKCMGMSEELKYGYNDIDYCLKVRECGFLVLFTPYALLYHHESISRQAEGDAMMRHVDDLKLFERKWKELLQNGDPYYSPNLSLKSYIPICKSDSAN